MKNCEKYKTVEERVNAFEKWCNIRGACKYCPLIDMGAEYESLVCAFHWLDLEAEKEVRNVQ